MERWQVRFFGPVLLVATVGIGGCHLMGPLDGSTTSVSNVEFMNVWKTYSHCRSSSDPDEMRTDAEQLGQAALAITREAQAPPPLPDFLQMLISEPPSRLAVDPKAMVMACTLRAEQGAHAVGQLGLAANLF
jgi:hypothetical protein